MKTLVLSLVVGAAIAASAGDAHSGAPPVTVADFPGIVRAFSENSGRIAWIDSAWIVRVRGLRGGTVHSIRYTNFYEEIPDYSGQRRLIAEGRTLLWISTRGVAMFIDADHVYAADVAAKQGRRLTTQEHVEGGDGDYVLGLAGDRTAFAYGVAKVKATNADQSAYQVVGGGVWSVGATTRRLPAVPPAIVLARAAGHIAIAPVATEEQQDGTPVPAGGVEIRDGASGALISSFDPGVIRAAAMDATRVAVLSGSKLSRYRVSDGGLVGSTSVPADTAAELEASPGRAVFRTRHSVRLIDLSTGRIRTLATTTWQPTAVAIDGRTVSWAESRRTAPGETSRSTFETRIRSLAVP